ncbi:DRC7, partial [Symbiodinium sp. KB8]
ELWLAGNPLLELPDALGGLRSLRVLDLRRTRLRRVPNAVSRLPRLLVLDLAGTSLRGDFQAALQDGGPAALLGLLGREDERLELQQQLREALRRRVFVADADTEGGAAAIDALAEKVMAEFPVSAELRTVIRNAERIFADPLERANAAAARDRYIALSKDTKRRQLGAEAELVIKAAYFGRADREVVSDGALCAEHRAAAILTAAARAGCVRETAALRLANAGHKGLERAAESVVAAQPTLSDIQFFLAHAREVLPAEAADVDGATVAGACVALRRRLQAERESAIAGLVRALSAKYADREPAEVDRTGRAVASLVRKTDHLRSLTADVGTLFPDEFNSINPAKVVRALRALQREKGVE